MTDFRIITHHALPACMGGLCIKRDRCQRHLTDDRRHVVERMCERGNEVPFPVWRLERQAA